MKNFMYIISLFFYALLFTSCETQKMFESANYEQMPEYNPYQHIIKTDDKVTVSVWNHEDLSIGSVYGIYNSNEVYGKWVLVDKNGMVKLPEIGSVKLGGLTLDGAKDTLANIYSKIVKDPVVEIKILNLEVTILGEVRTPGNYLIEKNNNNLIELIGRAGGMEFYADKEQIKIIRGDINKGDVKEYLIDLTDMSAVSSGQLNIYPGDVVYVPSKNGKALDKKAPTLIPFASAASALAVLVAILIK